MNVTVSRSDIIWSFLSVIMSFTASVITLPVVIFYLDSETLGLWYVFASIGSVTILFDFGFTVTFARNITYCWSGAKKLKKIGTAKEVNTEPDYYLMRDILSTCKRIYLIISVIALAVLLSIGTGYIAYVSRSMPGISHIVAWIIYAVGAFLNLYYNYYDSFLRGVGAVKQANQNRVYARVGQLCIMLILLALGLGILGLSIAYFFFGVIFRVLGKYYFYRYKGIGNAISRLSGETSEATIRELFKTVWYNAWRDGVVSLSVYLSGQASVILCSFFLSLSETGIYSVGLQIANVVGTLASTPYLTYQPSLQSNYVSGNTNKVREIMNTIVKVYVSTYLLGAVAVLLLGLPILRLIKPNVVISLSLMSGIFLSQFILKFKDCFSSYFSSTNRLIYMPSFIISSFLCVLLSVTFLYFFKMKIWGLIFAQIISQLIFNTWYWPYKAYAEYGNGKCNK